MLVGLRLITQNSLNTDLMRKRLHSIGLPATAIFPWLRFGTVSPAKTPGLLFNGTCWVAWIHSCFLLRREILQVSGISQEQPLQRLIFNYTGIFPGIRFLHSACRTLGYKSNPWSYGNIIISFWYIRSGRKPSRHYRKCPGHKSTTNSRT